MKSALLIALLALAGCAQNVWVKPGSSQQEFSMDAGQCKAQAFGVSMPTNMQIAMVYNSCMQGKGWNLERQQTSR